MKEIQAVYIFLRKASPRYWSAWHSGIFERNEWGFANHTRKIYQLRTIPVVQNNGFKDWNYGDMAGRGDVSPPKIVSVYPAPPISPSKDLNPTELSLTTSSS